MLECKMPSHSLGYMRTFNLLLLKTVSNVYTYYNLVLILLQRVSRMLKMVAKYWPFFTQSMRFCQHPTTNIKINQHTSNVHI